jgi:hypothetical protein
MTLTLTLNDQLVELGGLTTNTETAVQRVGARLIERFFTEYEQDAYEPTLETTALILYYLTETQVRDYALGMLDTSQTDTIIPALEFLLDQAPTDTIYINAPAAMLAQVQYEMGNTSDAFITLSNAQHDYSLAQLLYRVFKSGWEPTSFATMRKELHPKITAGIFGKDE